MNYCLIINYYVINKNTLFYILIQNLDIEYNENRFSIKWNIYIEFYKE